MSIHVRAAQQAREQPQSLVFPLRYAQPSEASSRVADSPGRTRASPQGDPMRAHSVAPSQSRRIVAGLPFVEALARRMAASMPNSIDVGDLVQDGVPGLIDAAKRFD